MLVSAPFHRGGLRLSDVFEQMVRVGVEALPMAYLTAFSIGLTLAIQGADQLTELGATYLVPSLVCLSLLKGVGPLLIGVIVIGRSGSAVTAELGAMKVSEEIEALNVMAIDPTRFLVIPRFIAMLVMLPALTVFGNYIGMVGGWIIARFTLDITTLEYISSCVESASPEDVGIGVFKSLVFGWLIISIACNAGMSVRGGAEGVGRATTQSVAYSLLAILVANAFITAFFVYL